MVVKKRGLGRGLDALLGGSHSSVISSISTDTVVDSSKVDPRDSELRNLSVDLLQPGKYQPRTNMHNDSLEELADSIRAQGILQPIVVRPLSEPGRYEIIAGERRWRAAQIAGLHDVPAIVRDVSDDAAIAMALIENIQREDLNPVEEATALQRLIKEFDMTHQQAAEAVGRSRAAVSNLLRLLALSSEVRKLLENGDLEMGHARAILTLESELQTQVARDIAQKGLSVREAEELVRKLRGSEGKDKGGKSKVDPNISRLQEDLSDKLGAKVIFQHANNGKGKVVLHYNSLDELDG
ncbi:MAG: ParB/RepB/Spo0J family partition protein, partial [Thiohalomonadales bacterium]